MSTKEKDIDLEDSMHFWIFDFLVLGRSRSQIQTILSILWLYGKGNITKV